jgi:hypothetical protein
MDKARLGKNQSYHRIEEFPATNERLNCVFTELQADPDQLTSTPPTS